MDTRLRLVLQPLLLQAGDGLFKGLLEALRNPNAHAPVGLGFGDGVSLLRLRVFIRRH